MVALPLVLCGIAVMAALASGGIAAVARYITKHDGLSTAIGALALPILNIAALSCWSVTMEADAPAPGNVILATLVVLAITVPITLLASRFTVRFMSRRAPLSDR